MDKIYLVSDYNFITKKTLIANNVKDFAFNKKDVYFNDDYQLSLPGPIQLYANYALNDIYINHLSVENKCLYGASIETKEEDLFLIPCLPDKWIECFTHELHIVKILQYNPTKPNKDISLTSLFVAVHTNLATVFIPPTPASLIYSNEYLDIYEVPLYLSGTEFYKILLQRKFENISESKKLELETLWSAFPELQVLQKLTDIETYVDIPVIGNKANYKDVEALALTSL